MRNASDPIRVPTLTRPLLLASSLFAAQFTPLAAMAQRAVPIVALSPPTATSVETLGMILGVRELTGGRLVVNDAGRRQIRLFDATLVRSTIVADSAPGTATSYGAFPMPLIPYLGDSSLFPDFQSRALLVYDGSGRVARVMSAPTDGMLESLIGNPAGIDPRGRLLYKNVPSIDMRLSNKDPSRSTITQSPDSAFILRVDFDSRRTDTIGRVLHPEGGRLSAIRTADGRAGLLTTINPLQTLDEWAVLSHGTIAFVRGHDYHVDWIHPDGTTSSTVKMPFDWKRLTDDDKRKLVDSARASESAKAARAPVSTPPTAQIGTGGRGSGGAPPAAMAIRREVAFAPLNEIADYYPPIRRGAAMADLEGNLWILPTTSAQSLRGELVYDVVRPGEGLVRRVRMPLGRSVAAFGKGGVIYLMSGDKANGFHIERAGVAR